MTDLQPSSSTGDVEVLLDQPFEPVPDGGETDGLMANNRAEEDPTEPKSMVDVSAVYQWLKSTYEYARPPRRYRLLNDENVLRNSVLSLRFNALCSAINTKMLNPNYPVMVIPGASPDSFPDTEPFNFNSATYFLPMCSLLGVAIASVFLGQISDRVGRKRVLLILSWISAIGSVAKYFAKETFWGFCITQIVFGFFLGNIPVAMAYIGDVFMSKQEKERELGILISYFVIGNSGGGIIAILMDESGLFAPLWVGAAMLAVAAMFTQGYMFDAEELRAQGIILDQTKTGGEEGDDEVRPETIDNKALTNIIMGAVFDNFGSMGLFPLCLSPLAIEHYLFDFTSAEPPEEPIMTLVGYQWLSVMVAAMVVPSTMITPHTFKRFGVAGTCVMGNTMTALVTMALLLIGNAPATNALFGVFVTVMYIGFPFTVLSQLTTGPMLDVIAPADKLGYVQGLNNAAMNFGMAIAPWLFGLLADSTSTNIAISTGIAVSCCAALVNSPLMCDSRFGRQKPQVHWSKRALSNEDPEFVEKALAGEPVDQEALMLINLERLATGKPNIIPRVKPYSEDKESGLRELHGYADEVFAQRRDIMSRILAAINDPEQKRSKEEICQMLNRTLYSNEEGIKEATHDLGQWVGDYLLDAGYNPHTTSAVIKQMIMTALPPITFDKQVTPENLELAMLRSIRVFDGYVHANRRMEKKDWKFTDTMGKGSAAVFYS